MRSMLKKKKTTCKITQNPCLHQDPVPGVGVILKDLHSNLVGVEQVGNTSEGVTKEKKKKNK